MELKNYPNDFSSAHADNAFSLVNVDPTSPVDVIFYNVDGDIVALRRYVGCERVDSSPKSILLRMLSPEPLAKVEECCFVCPEGRDALLSMEYDGGEGYTPEILFTASHHNHSANTIMGEQEQWRTIAPGECDEVAFCVASEATISATLWVDGVMQSEVADFTPSSNGVVLFALSANDLLSRLRKPEDVSAFDLQFDIDGARCAVVHYRLGTPSRSDVRLAWLNHEGGISYHTFRCPTITTHRTSKECDTPSGRQVVSVESWMERKVQSQVLSVAEAQRLSEVLSSPRVWLCTEGGFESQIILSHELPLEGEGARRMTLSLRPAKSQIVTL